MTGRATRPRASPADPIAAGRNRVAEHSESAQGAGSLARPTRPLAEVRTCRTRRRLQRPLLHTVGTPVTQPLPHLDLVNTDALTVWTSPCRSHAPSGPKRTTIRGSWGLSVSYTRKTFTISPTPARPTTFTARVPVFGGANGRLTLVWASALRPRIPGRRSDPNSVPASEPMK